MDEDELEPPRPRLSDVKCPRCLEAAPVGAVRGPHCRQPLGDITRSIPLILAVAGVLALAVLCFFVYRTATAQAEPPAVEEPAADAFGPSPDTSAGHETQAAPPSAQPTPKESPAPEKKAPLDR